LVNESKTLLIPQSIPQSPPYKIDIEIVELIHQDPEGYIVLWRRLATKGEWHWKSIRVSEIRNILTTLESQPLYECYMSVNSFIKPRMGPDGMQYRKKDMLYSLNACYSDLDIYDKVE